MNFRNLPIALIILSLAGTAEAKPGWPESVVAPKPLREAHRAFMRGDLERMAIELRTALEQFGEEPGVRDNAIALLEKAYEVAGKKGIPADWTLPDAVTSMAISQRRVQRPERLQWELRVKGELKRKGAIKNLQVVRHPNEVVLDRRSGLGEWEESVDAEGVFEYELTQERTQEPMPEGLYRLSIELDDGSKHHGWFVLASLIATRSPVVHQPAPGDTITARQPRLRFDSFRSPEMKPYERRHAWLAIARLEPPEYVWEEAWSAYLHDPLIEELVAGDATHGKAVELADGRYVFHLTYKEKRRFGPIELRRDATTVVPFRIAGR